jgi:hypothetical protein
MSEVEPSLSSELCGGEDAICVGSTTQNNLPENDKIMHRNDETIHMQLSATTHDLLPVASLTLLFFSLVAWVFFRHIKHQKEWQQASNLQLKRISQRNKNMIMQPKEEAKSEIRAAAKQIDTTSSSSSSSSSACKEMQCLDKESVRSIREQQQKQHEIKAKLAKQHKQHAEKEKKRLLYESLQHDVADEAYERRRKVISEEQEQSILQANLQQPSEAQTQTNELEETERRELLRVQNLEYEESLRRDQERLMQATIEAERCRKRARTIQDCIHRLERAGIYTAGLPIMEHKNNTTKVEVSDDDKIQVRLMFPSGKRVQATYSKRHSIGLIYDLCLVILNYNQRDLEQIEISTPEEVATDEQREHAEWKELFDPFTIKTTFPPQTFDEMNLTLEQCGLQQSVMLMVIVETD